MSLKIQEHEEKQEFEGLSEWLHSVFVHEWNRSLDPGKWTGDLLYDAAQFLCQRRGITICHYERLKRACSAHCSFSDIARLSGFSCREITLPATWPSKRYEPVLVFLQEADYDGKVMEIPVICYSGFFGRLCVFDPRTDTIRNMPEGEQKKLGRKAWVACRPFSSPQVGFQELARFSLRELSVVHILLTITAMLLLSQIGLAISALSETIYDKIIPMGNSLIMYELGGLFLTVLLANLLFSLTQKLSQQGLTDRLRYALQAAVYDRLFHLEESLTSGRESGVIAFQASNLAGTYVMVFQNVVTILLQSSFSLFYCSRMVTLSQGLARIGFTVAGLEMMVTIITSIIMRSYSSKNTRLTGQVQSFLFQVFGGITTVRTAGAENAVLDRYMQQEVELSRNDRKNSLATLLSSQLITAGNSLALLFLYHQVGSSTGTSLGTFMSFLSAYTFFISAMIQTASSSANLIAMIPVMRYSSDILKQKAERSNTGTIITDFRGDILLSHVSFAYKGQNRAVLRDVSVHIHSGEYVGIVGQTGSGKSTLLRLLLGFETPGAGVICYDGVPTKLLNMPELRRKIGTVLQDGCLFTGTIYKNISIGAPGIRPEQVQKAVDTACLTDEIKAMPMGLQTVVSEEGYTISGGQKQRILLARAIINHPSLLLLDEATSSLDNRLQKRITQNLSELKATRIVVAHRLSTIQNCDRILVLDKGQLVEEGSYESLMDKRGIFWQMASRQIPEKIEN